MSPGMTNQAGNYSTGSAVKSTVKGLQVRLLRGRLISARLTHNKVESTRTNLAESPVSVQRHGNGDGRVVSLESHTACDEKIVEFVHVERFARFAQQQRAGLGDGPIGKAMTDRFDIVGARWNSAASRVHVRDRIRRTISHRRFCSWVRSLVRLRTAIVIIFDPKCLSDIESPIAGPHRHK